MLRVCVAILVALCATGCGAAQRGVPAAAPEGQREKFISFNGMGRVFYQPSLLDLSFSVNTEGPDINAALKVHQDKMKAVDACIAGFGEHVQMRLVKPNRILRKEKVHEERNVRITEIWYEFTSDYYLRLDAVGKVDEVQAEIIRSGVNEIAYMDFFSDQLERFKEEARNNAIDDASAKMASLAKKMGWRNIRIRDIGVQNEEYVSYNRDTQASAMFGVRTGGGRRASTAAPKGLQFIDAKVSINYLYEE